MYEGRHRVVHRSHHLRRHLYEGDLEAQLVEVLRHLQPDEAPTDDDGTLGLMSLQIVLDPIRVSDIAQGEDPLEVYPWEGWTQRCSPRGEEQLVIVLGIAAPIRRTYADLLPLGVYGRGLTLSAHVDVEPTGKGSGCLDEEAIALLDHAPDIIRKATVGIGDILSPLEEDDLGLLTEASDTSGSCGSACDPTDDEVLLL